MKVYLRIVAVLAAVLALLALVLGGWQYYRLQKAADALPVNTRLGGDFLLPSTRGDLLDTASLRGKVVLLNFGFTSCPRCLPHGAGPPQAGAGRARSRCRSPTAHREAETAKAHRG